MTLTDLQIELREIEEKIKKLHVEIENMKPKAINDNHKKFLSINILAKQSPINIETLNLSSKTQKVLFVNVLAYIVSLDRINFYEKLLYLCRMSNGCGLKLEAEEIYKGGLKFEEQDVGRISEELRGLRYVLLVEALVIANITGKASSVVLSEIAEIASLLTVNKIELQLISQVAKSKLSKNLDLLNGYSIPEVIAVDNKFNDYIPQEWIEKQRKKCCDPICLTGHFKGQNSSPTINYKTTIEKQWKNNNEMVRKGGSIFKCLRPIKKGATKKVNDIIKAPKSGKLFIIDYRVKSEVQNKNDTYRAVYVVSYYDNYKDFCEWIKAKIKFDRIVKKF